MKKFDRKEKEKSDIKRITRKSDIQDNKRITRKN